MVKIKSNTYHKFVRHYNYDDMKRIIAELIKEPCVQSAKITHTISFAYHDPVSGITAYVGVHFDRVVFTYTSIPLGKLIRGKVIRDLEGLILRLIQTIEKKVTGYDSHGIILQVETSQ